MINVRILWTVILLTIAGSAASEMRELQNDTLRNVTAGTDNDHPADNANHAPGGIVVANGSAATVDETSEIVLDTDAQNSARGVNIVNASKSLVAQGVNIWDGNFLNTNAALDPTIDQSNMVVQSASTRSASVQNYERDSNSTETSTLSTTANNTDTVDLVSEVMVDTSHTVLGQNVNIGLGVGLAGRVGIDLGAATIDVGLSATSDIDIGIGVSGEIDLPWPLGTMTADGQLDMRIINSGEFNVNVETPPIQIDAIGAVCYTKLGVCTASADDNSTYSTSTTSDESFELDIRGALSVDQVRAEYIVIDESTLDVTSGHSIRLASGAQSNLAAVNAVNAVGSLVANGVNVSRTSLDGGDLAMPLNLSQRNIIIQGM
jgi:hypothetical protein